MDKYWFPVFWKSAKRTFVHVDTSSESENKKFFFINLILHNDMVAILSGLYLLYIYNLK